MIDEGALRAYVSAELPRIGRPTSPHGVVRSQLSMTLRQALVAGRMAEGPVHVIASPATGLTGQMTAPIRDLDLRAVWNQGVGKIAIGMAADATVNPSAVRAAADMVNGIASVGTYRRVCALGEIAHIAEVIARRRLPPPKRCGPGWHVCMRSEVDAAALVAANIPVEGAQASTAAVWGAGEPYDLGSFGDRIYDALQVLDPKQGELIWNGLQTVLQGTLVWRPWEQPICVTIAEPQDRRIGFILEACLRTATQRDPKRGLPLATILIDEPLLVGEARACAIEIQRLGRKHNCSLVVISAPGATDDDLNQYVSFTIIDIDGVPHLRDVDGAVVSLAPVLAGPAPMAGHSLLMSGVVP